MTTNFTTFQSQFFNAVAAVSSDVTWTTEFPLVIDRAEQRAYRDLDMMMTHVIIGYGALSLQRYQSTLNGPLTTFLIGFATSSAPAFISYEQINVFTPVGAGSTGTRNTLVRASPAFIDLTCPSDTTSPGVPQYYAPLSDQTIMMGPAPNAGYQWEVRGAIRPLALSSGNSSTPLTQTYPDLFFASAMIEAGMYMRFVEPAMAQTWKQEYDLLKASAVIEEQRKRGMAEGWVGHQPSPIATPPRQ